MYNRQAGTPSDEELAEAKKAYELRMGIVTAQQLGDEASLNDPRYAEVREAREKRAKKDVPPESGAALSDAAILEIDARLCKVEMLTAEVENLRDRVITLEANARAERKTANKKQAIEQEVPAFVES